MERARCGAPARTRCRRAFSAAHNMRGGGRRLAPRGRKQVSLSIIAVDEDDIEDAEGAARRFHAFLAFNARLIVATKRSPLAVSTNATAAWI